MASSMKDLVDRDCGGANPLMKLTSHVLNDRAYRQEGFTRGHFNSLPPGSLPLAEASANRLVDEYLSEQLIGQPGSLHALGRPMAPTSFRMDSLLREMEEMERGAAAAVAAPLCNNDLSNQWASDYLEGSGSHQGAGDADWSTEFVDYSAQQPIEAKRVLIGSDQWAKDYLDASEHAVWSEEFDQRFSDKPDWLNTNHLSGHAEQETTGQSEADWAAQFEAEESSANEKLDEEFWKKMEKEWEENMKNAVGRMDDFHPWSSDFDSYQTNPAYLEYKFDEENYLRDHPDPFGEGLERLKRGDIPNAVLLFEAAVQNEPGRAEAWLYLGTTQADNEQEPASIAALNKCLELEPGNRKALLSLAVSYTNEMQQQAACGALLRWLRASPLYAHLVPAELGTDAHSTVQFNQVKDIFISAVQTNQTDIDADVQTCLGVLFNISGEYDKAVDCFSAALQVRPQDSLLWNKLGATLANGRRSEESVEAYHNALRLSPGYIRTRYNLGIACINLQAYREAVEHFLTALNLQHSSSLSPSSLGGAAGGEGGGASRRGAQQSVMSSNIWSTLRMALSMFGRNDLHFACDNKDLDTLKIEFNIDT